MVDSMLENTLKIESMGMEHSFGLTAGNMRGCGLRVGSTAMANILTRKGKSIKEFGDKGIHQTILELIIYVIYIRFLNNHTIMKECCNYYT